MWIKAAYFRNTGVKTPSTPIVMSDLHNAWKNSIAAGITTNKNLHDFAGWARLLIYSRRAMGLSPPYNPMLELQIIRVADAARQNWDPIMRYHHLRLQPGETKIVENAASWVKGQYNTL